MNTTLQIQPETLRWRSREVRYYAGAWDDVLSVLPEFETVPFCAGPLEPSNPFLLTVSRKPLSAVQRPMPVGVVSHRYSLVQHRDVATRCREGLVSAGVKTVDLRYEVGVSQLGEWMNFRIYFPEKYSLRDSHGEKVDLRLECFKACAGKARSRGTRCRDVIFETLFETLWVSNPIRPRSAASRNRVMRGPGVTQGAKRSQGARRPRD